MSRNRAPVNGGYSRKTVSLPSGLVKRIDAFLKKNPGLTMSSFMTDAGELFLRSEKKPRRSRK